MKAFARQCGFLGLMCLAIMGLWLVGCASKTAPSEASRPGNGIAEYRRIATGAEQAIHAALDSLSEIAGQSNSCSPEVLYRFSEEVRRLQVESIQVRSRSQAMQARGDAYFERWHENMARVEDPRLRSLAEARRPQLQERFQQIKSLSQEAHEAFRPFLADLRQLRNALEKDLASIDAAPSRNWIRTAMENGKHAERCVGEIGRELDSMSAMLTASGNDNPK